MESDNSESPWWGLEYRRASKNEKFVGDLSGGVGGERGGDRSWAIELV